MKIISWNVAGFRACLKKGFDDFFKEIDADVFCIQESKVLPEQERKSLGRCHRVALYQHPRFDSCRHRQGQQGFLRREQVPF